MSDNIEVKLYNDKVSATQTKKDLSDISDGRGMEVPIKTSNIMDDLRKAQNILK